LLEKHVKERELGDLGKRLDGLKERLADKIDVKAVAGLIREDRERL